MDNKRKGSDSPRSPAGSGRFEWDEPLPRDSFSFSDDDDAGPLPAPPEFDVRRGGVPELLDGEEMIEEVETVEDDELLDSALVTEVRSTHAMPPPIPAPVPTGPSQRVFIDDGEIALPPRISRHVQSFPFRKLRGDDEPGPQEDDDGPGPGTAGWHSAAVGGPDDDDDEPQPVSGEDSQVLAPDELDAAEVDDPGLRFTDDDDDAPPARSHAAPFPVSAPHASPPHAPPAHSHAPPAHSHAPPAPPVRPQPPRDLPAFTDDDEAPLFADNDAEAAPLSRADDPPSATDDRWGSGPRAPLSGVRDDDEPVSADMFGAQLANEPEVAPVALREASRSRMFAEEPGRADDTVADGRLVDDDDTGLYQDVRQNAATGMFTRDELKRPTASRSPLAAVPSDDELRLPVDEDVLPARDVEEPSESFAAQRVPEASMSGGTSGLPADDDENAGWVHARGPQPSAAIPVAEFSDDDDDDETWAKPAASPAAQPVTPPASTLPPTQPPTRAASSLPPTLPPTSTVRVPLPGLPPVIRDSETSGWIATRPGASIASGAIPVAELDDDEDAWPLPTAPVAAPVAAPIAAPVAAEPEPESQEEDDDEWQSQTQAPNVGLAPEPTDLGEPFPLDLWSDPDELLGRELGGYRLDRPMSRGNITRVYLGEELETGRRVAIRVLGPMHSPAEPRARQFLYEAQQLMKLHSEHIVEVLAAGYTTDHLTYYVMEHLAGESLASALRNEGPMPWADVAAFANQICDALVLAGERGIMHVDLTAATCVRLPGEPARSEGERRRDLIKLLGVGVTPLTSVFRNSEGNWTLSQGTPPGTAEFMAPEIAGGGRPDARTTVYALGVLMYELTTGRPPFRGDSFISVLKKQMYEEATPPRLVVPEQEIPEVFEAVVHKALAKAPGDRYSDLRALDEALLAARAREGELRRVTQILALDPAFWDEDGSRRVKQPSSPVPAFSPTPLSTFANDMKQRQPELAAAVFKPEPRAGREPSMALHLTQLAAPIVAPALPPVQAAGAVPVIVLARPPAPAASGSLFRNISLAIVIASAVVMAALWLSDRPRPPRKGDEVSAEVRRPTKPKTRPSRDIRTRDDAPVVMPPSDEPPATVLAPPPEPEGQPQPEVVKQAPPPDPEPEPEVKQAPPPDPEPVKPPANTVVPDKPAAPVQKPSKPKVDPLDDRPDSITPGRLQAKLKSMEERVVSRCRGKVGVPNTRGISVSVIVRVDVKGEVKAKSTGQWAGTPLGQCIEEVLEAIRFNETRKGGGRTHTFKF